MTEPTPQDVNKDIVAAYTVAASYSHKNWLTGFFALLVYAGGFCWISWVFPPSHRILIGSLTTAAVLVLIGLNLHWRSRWQQQFLRSRNALERRLNIPETARHREGYDSGDQL